MLALSSSGRDDSFDTIRMNARVLINLPAGLGRKTTMEAVHALTRTWKIEAVPCLSIIIPHVGSTGPLENTLASVLQNRPADCEILLVHPGTYEDPYDLAGEVRFVETPSDSTLADSLNVALQTAAGEYLHVICPGIEVEESWCDDAIARFDDPPTAAVCPLVLKRETPNVIAEAGVRLNGLGQRRTVGNGTKHRFSKIAKLKPTGPSLAAAFYRRDALEQIGWFATDVGSDLADIDAALSLKQAGYKCCLEPEATLWSVEELEDNHSASLARARGSERMIWRHAPIRGIRRTILSRFFLVAVLLSCGLVRPRLLKQALGRILPWFEIGNHRRRWHELDAIRMENSQMDEQLPEIKTLPVTNPDDKAVDEDGVRDRKHHLKRAS